jgi:hypothetical protein
VRVQAVGGRGTIRAVVELDSVTAKLPEWLSGGTLRLTFEPERPGASNAGQSQTLTIAIDPGQRSIVIPRSERPLAAGRYSVRAELTRAQRADANPGDDVRDRSRRRGGSRHGWSGSRRGPSTGLAYVATADPRFRRTERLRIEVPLAGEGFAGIGRLLTREGRRRR